MQTAKNITETAVKAAKMFTPQGAALSAAETFAKKAGSNALRNFVNKASEAEPLKIQKKLLAHRNAIGLA